MAIVKLVMVDGEPRVLTKTVDGEVRVSCSCCEELFCCMYPAQLVSEEVLTHEDLPDEVRIPFGTFEFDIVVQKIVPPNDLGGIVFYYENTTAQEGYEAGDITISLTEGSDAWQIDLAGSLTYPACLITGEATFPITEDLFADTYEVTGPINGIVARQSICLWTGEGLTLLYRSQAFPDSPPYIANVGKWSLNGEIKDGFQDSPVGTYGDYTVSE